MKTNHKSIVRLTLSRLPLSAWSVSAFVWLALAPGSSAAVNTVNNFTGSTTGSLLTTGNWSLSALPLVGNCPSNQIVRLI